MGSDSIVFHPEVIGSDEEGGFNEDQHNCVNNMSLDIDIYIIKYHRHVQIEKIQRKESVHRRKISIYKFYMTVQYYFKKNSKLWIVQRTYIFPTL